MKRRLVKLVVFLLLGAIVNVAVAWGCAALRQPLTAKSVDHVATPLEWRARWHHTPTHYGQKGRFGTTCRMWMTLSDDPQAFLMIIASGWPRRALVITRTDEVHSTTRYVAQSISVYLRAGMRFVGEDANMPLRPVWPGFAINTVFYAVILWMLFAAPFALRRRRRIRRGLCPACAYPVGDSPVCTECGRAVTPPST